MRLLSILAAACFLAAPAVADDPKDYQKIADAASWAWTPEHANLLDSVTHYQGDYQIEIIRKKNSFGVLTIRFTKDDKVIHSWEGHAGTVLVGDGDVLYYADYYPGRTGCSLVAVDLKTGKHLWKTDLQGLGPIAHFGYRNSVTLESADDALLVHGHESAGNYVEYVDKKIGKTVGHKVFKDK